MTESKVTDAAFVAAAIMARNRLVAYGNEANAGRAQAGGRELQRKIWGAFAEFDEICANPAAALSARPQPPQQPVAWRLRERIWAGTDDEYWAEWRMAGETLALQLNADPLYEVEPLYAAPLAQPVATAGEERESVAEVVWEMFSERMGGPWDPKSETMAAERSYATADEILRRLAALRPPVTQPNAEEAGK